MVRRSLGGLAAAVPAGGYLVYTGQPWHPQVEMIARVLTNRDGRPWIMRRRTQEEMDDLVREAGFHKIDRGDRSVGNFHGLAGTSYRPLMVRAAVASVGLSLLFLAVYSGTNWLSSQRSDVGTWYYAWERLIPFVPLMVIPYMSIDLFFAAAPFLCRDRRELTVFSRRITLAILAAGVCFLVMPLKLGQPRPHVDGWLGALFGWFFATDLPYNLCPSLHIALRTILAETYARHSRGVWNVASHVWFSLVGFSTLLTYQHHVVDVAGGFLLAAVCFYVVPAIAQRHPVVPNRHIGSYYFLALGQRCGGRIVLALGKHSAVARAGLSGGHGRLFRARPGDLSEKRGTPHFEHAAPARAATGRSAVVLAILPAAMPGVGRRDAAGLDRSKAFRPRGRRGRAAGRGRRFGRNYRVLRGRALFGNALPERAHPGSDGPDARATPALRRVRDRERRPRGGLRSLQDRLFAERGRGGGVSLAKRRRAHGGRGYGPLARRATIAGDSSGSGGVAAAF